MSNSYETFLQRQRRTQADMKSSGFDLAIITPGPNLRYLTNFKANALERITALVLSHNEAWMIVPELEFHAATEFFKELQVIPWGELDDPYQLIFDRSPKSKNILLDQNMKYLHVEKFQSVFKDVSYYNLANVLLSQRAVKSTFELDELSKVSESINKVHKHIMSLRFNQKTEIQLAREIHDLILQEHESVDFVIVASGTNSANPHHVPNDRVIALGDPVIIDIGGTSASGYCSDCTRTYHVGEDIDADFYESYEFLKSAQNLGVTSVAVGIEAQELDALVRNKLAEAQLDQWFIHRLGHGIGMETHEDPYLVNSNEYLLQKGNAFSIEPGFYIPNKWGARIEDIVIIDDSGVKNLNDFDHDLRIVN